MTGLLLKLFVPGLAEPPTAAQRLRCGYLAGIVGIVVNALLFVLKLAVGVASGSIAIAADAVNNLSDCGCSGVTLLGVRYAAKPADREHPFGHGRLEYVATVVMAVVIISVGGTFLKDSLVRVWHPSRLRLSTLALALYGASALVKAWLFFFYRRLGKAAVSLFLAAQALDARNDILMTLAVFVAVWSSRWTRLPVDGLAGTATALFVLWSGGRLLMQATSPLLGETPSSGIVDQLRKCLLSVPGINGVHDIIIHNYGPSRYFASAHAEIDPNQSVVAAHDLMERAEAAVQAQMPVTLLLHCDPFQNTPRTEGLLHDLEAAAVAAAPGSRVSDFRVEWREDGIVLDFDLTVPPALAAGRAEISAALDRAMQGTPHNPRGLPVTLKIDFREAYV